MDSLFRTKIRLPQHAIPAAPQLSVEGPIRATWRSRRSSLGAAAAKNPVPTFFKSEVPRIVCVGYRASAAARRTTLPDPNPDAVFPLPE